MALFLLYGGVCRAVATSRIKPAFKVSLAAIVYSKFFGTDTNASAAILVTRMHLPQAAEASVLMRLIFVILQIQLILAPGIRGNFFR